MDQSIRKPRLSDILVTRIQEQILEYDLKPGDRLATEQELAKKFGVSRLAVREATKSLEFLGIIDSSPGRGLTVGTQAFERLIPLLRVHPANRNLRPKELIETRIIVETGALPFVGRKIAADQKVYFRLREINEQMQESKKLEQWIKYDIAFHRALLEESGLRTLVAFGELLEVFFHRYREGIKTKQWRGGALSHLRIINYLRAGKLAQACEELRTHISTHTEHFGK